MIGDACALAKATTSWATAYSTDSRTPRSAPASFGQPVEPIVRGTLSSPRRGESSGVGRDPGVFAMAAHLRAVETGDPGGSARHQGRARRTAMLQQRRSRAPLAGFLRHFALGQSHGWTPSSAACVPRGSRLRDRLQSRLQGAPINSRGLRASPTIKSSKTPVLFVRAAGTRRRSGHDDIGGGGRRAGRHATLVIVEPARAADRPLVYTPRSEGAAS